MITEKEYFCLVPKHSDSFAPLKPSPPQRFSFCSRTTPTCLASHPIDMKLVCKKESLETLQCVVVAAVANVDLELVDLESGGKDRLYNPTIIWFIVQATAFVCSEINGHWYASSMLAVRERLWCQCCLQVLLFVDACIFLVFTRFVACQVLVYVQQLHFGESIRYGLQSNEVYFARFFHLLLRRGAVAEHR